MNETFSSFDEDELSEEDLAILRAFDALEHINTADSVTDTPSSNADVTRNTQESGSDVELDEDAEMLMIFLEEVTEDISRMRQALNPLGQGEPEQQDTTHLQVFQRAGHKIRGTTGAVGYTTMSIVAQHIELIAEQANNGILFPAQAHAAILQAVTALELCLQHLVQEGKEPEDAAFITDLEHYYHSLGINPDDPEQSQRRPLPEQPAGQVQPAQGADTAAESIPTLSAAGNQSQPTFMRIDNRRFDMLLQHTEQLVGQNTPIEDAEHSLAHALQDLQKAEEQLQQIEQSLSQAILQRGENEEKTATELAFNALTTSSLIARILASSEASSRIHQRHRRSSSSSSRQQPTQSDNEQNETKKSNDAWDELDIESYTEKDLLLHSLREAIVELSRCTSRAMLAQTALQMAQQAYTQQVNLIHKDIQMIRLIPFSTLVPHLQQVIETSLLAQQHKIVFEVSGEQTEIDQEILERLTPPLLKMLHTCIADPGILEAEESQQHRIWLQISKSEGDITIEIGFSMPVQGGAVEIMHETMRHLHGTIHFPRTTEDEIRFLLRFPGSQGPAHCLVVRVGDQNLLVTLNQILHVGVMEYEQPLPSYHLQELLGYPYAGSAASSTPANPPTFQSLLVIHHPVTREPLGIVVDEIEAETEMVIKPLKPYLQRPGIVGSAINGRGNVLLALDLHELLLHFSQQDPALRPPAAKYDPANQKISKQKPRILLADDSAYLRKTILNMLPQTLYSIIEARDGREALEQLLENTPDIFLLDIEMPNLNGYDLLTLMQEYPELQHVKTIMLTSRTSDKHRQRALELGAKGYLTKPCDQPLLLNTIAQLLNSEQQSADREPAGSQHQLYS